jgi:hypothetical protein
MIHRTVISLVTAGVIIMAIPLLFFTVGTWVEVKITKRETERYISSICHNPLFSSESLDLVNAYIKDNTNTDYDIGVIKENKNIRNKSFVICTGLMLILCCTGLIIALYSHMDMKRIAVDSLVGILLFVFVEIGVLLLLFQRYCPLDVNAVNKKILERIV